MAKFFERLLLRNKYAINLICKILLTDISCKLSASTLCFALYSKILSKLHRIETYINRMYAKQGPAFGHGFRQAHQAKMWNQKLSKNTSLTHIPPLAKSNFLHNTQDRRIKHCRQYVSSKQNPPNITWHTWIETTIKKKVARLFIGEPIS